LEPLTLDQAIGSSTSQYEEYAVRPIPGGEWESTNLELLSTVGHRGGYLYAKTNVHPFVTPVYRNEPWDDTGPLWGFRAAESLEQLVGLWLELFDGGMYFEPNHPTGWIIGADEQRAAEISLAAWRAGWNGTESGARDSYEWARQVRDRGIG